jgi:hypothetical protein
VIFVAHLGSEFPLSLLFISVDFMIPLTAEPPKILALDKRLRCSRQDIGEYTAPGYHGVACSFGAPKPVQICTLGRDNWQR